MKSIALAAALVASLGAGAACAQAMDNFVSTFVGAADLAGQGMAEGAVAGPSVFVTATGHAPRPRTGAQVFGIDLEASAPQAGAAEHDLAGKVDLALAAARRLGVLAAVADQGFAGADDGNPMAAFMKAQANKDEKPAPADGPKMTARATIWFTAPNVAQEASLLDALAAARIDYKLTGRAKSFLPGLDIGKPPEPLDPGVWDEATRQAMTEARRQAAVVAGAAGEGVGEARQILVVTRSTEPYQVDVTVAVRFALKPER